METFSFSVGGGWGIAWGMSPHVSPASSRRWVRFGVGVGMLLLAWLGWSGWRAYDFRGAVREAEAAGFSFEQSPVAVALIRADWHAAFRAATWSERSRRLKLPEQCDLAQHQTLLLRLRPTRLEAYGCRNVSAIRGLTGLHELILAISEVKDLAPLARLTQLQRLWLTGCTGVVDLTPLRDLAQLQTLNLGGCTGVVDLAPLHGLAQLRTLWVDGCTGVADLAPLQSLTQLQWLDLNGCTGVVDLAPLHGLAQLERLNLEGCTGLSAEAVAAFKKSHPQTEVEGP